MIQYKKFGKVIATKNTHEYEYKNSTNAAPLLAHDGSAPFDERRELARAKLAQMGI